MKRYIVGICDDDKVFCGEIEHIINVFFKKHLLGVEVYVWYDGESCISDLEKIKQLHILFLDIDLNSMRGIEIAKHIRGILNDAMMQIVFVSAKTDYALELFNTHPFDFIEKPIEEHRLKQVLELLVRANDRDGRCYSFTVRGTMYRIPFGEIELLESDNKHLVLRKANGDKVVYVGKLSEEIKFFTSGFMRTSKSCIVNMKYISKYRNDYVEMYDGEVRFISKSCRKEAREIFHRFIEEDCL